MVVYDFLPSPRWGEGLGVRGEAPATSRPPSPQPSPPQSRGRGRQKGSPSWAECSVTSFTPEKPCHKRTRSRRSGRLVFRLFTEGLAPFGFSPFGATIYFIRDRGPVRDALFIQKMRSNTLTIAYGVSIPPKDGPWSPGLLRARWLNKHEFFNVKSEEHTREDQSPAHSGHFSARLCHGSSGSRVLLTSTIRPN